MRYVLQTKNLTKMYGKTKAKVVNRFSLNMEKGHIYGLIGPNGAGKTTIMKMIAGIIMPDEGEIKLFENKNNLDKERSRMSFMIETPLIDGSMNARQNMQYIRFVRGVEDEKRIDEVLEFIGLKDVRDKKVKLFSLGMKQRLAIGMALLPRPEIMVLDEPVNGLDPKGIVDIRNILKKLCEEQGITILISSHLLSELSELCTDYIIINKGTLIENMSVEELEKKCRTYIAIRTNDIEKTAAILEQKAGIEKYEVIENNEIHIYERLKDIEFISKTITDNNLIITRLNTEGDNLEQYYLSKISLED